MNKNKGFTLIELLVVIAIIVILASIVLVGIQSATKKAKDARIIADISQIRTQQEVIFSSANSYLDDEDTTPTAYTGSEIEKLVKDITAQGGTVTINADANHYCVYSTLIETSGSVQCIDSEGNSKKLTAAPTATCNDTTYTCE